MVFLLSLAYLGWFSYNLLDYRWCLVRVHLYCSQLVLCYSREHEF